MVPAVGGGEVRAVETESKVPASEDLEYLEGFPEAVTLKPTLKREWNLARIEEKLLSR